MSGMWMSRHSIWRTAKTHEIQTRGLDSRPVCGQGWLGREEARKCIGLAGTGGILPQRQKDTKSPGNPICRLCVISNHGMSRWHVNAPCQLQKRYTWMTNTRNRQSTIKWTEMKRESKQGCMTDRVPGRRLTHLTYPYYWVTQFKSNEFELDTTHIPSMS